MINIITYKYNILYMYVTYKQTLRTQCIRSLMCNLHKTHKILNIHELASKFIIRTYTGYM